VPARHPLASPAALTALLAGLASVVAAQSTKAELSGIVRDPAKLPVEGAWVELANTGTRVTALAVTAPDGAYHFFAVPTGRFEITVAKEGFSTLRRDGVVLRVGDQVRLDLELAVGDFTEIVEVTAAAPLLQVSRGTVSFVLEQKKLIALPLDGRNFVPLLALSPGVSLPPGSLFPRINGGRPRVSEYLYDGISVLQPEPGQVAFYPILDAIEEFRVETNSFSAEYGRANGGVILVNQKSGSNEYHGTLFEFFRHEKLNARNLFATTGPRPRFRRNQYGFVFGGPLQKNRTFFFGDAQQARLGTGVVRTSTVPSSAQKQGLFARPIFDPATTRRAGSAYARDPFPDHTIPPVRWDRAALAVVDRYPAPNVAAGRLEATANNYTRVGNDRTAQDQFDARADRYFGARHAVFARYSRLRDDGRPATPLPDGSGDITVGVIGNTVTRAGSVAAEHTWSLAPAAVNQIRFGYTRRQFARSALRTGRPLEQLTLIPGIPASSFPDALPIYDLVGFEQLGPPANSNARFATSVTQWIDNYSSVRGRHSIKAGTDLRLQHLDVLQPPSPTGQYQFTSIFTSGLTAAGTPVAGAGDSFASFLLGQVGRFSIDAQPEILKPRATIAEFFAQDDWRAARRLSLNLGVRYTLNFPSTVVGDRGAVFDMKAQRLDFLGRNGFPRSARNLEKTNFGPRAGLALRVTESLVIRSGYGLTWIEQAGITTPFTTPLFPFVQSLGQQTLDGINPAFVLSHGPLVRLQDPNPDTGLGQGVFPVQRDNGSGYAQQWNFTIQKTSGGHWSLEAGYLGSKLTRLGVPDVNLNQLPASSLALGPLLTEPAPNPWFGRIPANTPLGGPTLPRHQLLRPFPRFTTVTLYRNNVGHSTYHSFQSRIEKRFSRGLTFTTAYTFSKLIDDAGAVFDASILTGPVANFQAADSFNRRLEKDVSTGHMPHILSGGFVCELPFGRGRARSRGGWRAALAGGWQLAGLVRVQSGTPVAVTQATNLNAFAGFGAQRPSRLSNPALPASQRSPSRWFDTAAFALAPQFTLGSSSRNPVTGPGYRTVDLMAGRTFRTGERWRIEFRAEAFNVTNTPPLGNPSGSFGTAAFGTITRALDPRAFELVGKIQF